MHHNLIIKDGDTTKVVKEVLVDGIQFVDETPRAGSTNPVTAMFAIADNAEIYNARLQRFSSITVNSSGQSTITESNTNGKWYYLVPKVFTREKGVGLYNLALAHKLNELLAMRKEGFENKVTRMPR